MPPSPVSPETVIGVSPFGMADARLAGAVSRAGGLGVLDLGPGPDDPDDPDPRAELHRLARWLPGRYGVRAAPGCALTPGDLAALGDAGPHTVLLDCRPPPAAASPWDPERLCRTHRVLAEVTCLAEARRAVAAGAAGLLARGGECGGRAGELGTFLLLQQLTADPELRVPVWAWGGIGVRTAAAAVAGGAAGVVLDTQLALLEESTLPETVRAALRAAVPHPASEPRPERARGSYPLRQGQPRPGTPHRAALPAGQDGPLAPRFAAEFATVPAALRALRAATAAPSAPDTPGEPDTADAPNGTVRPTGTRLPIGQGPMTRVSDQPRFAAAVADAGGLPFQALALADGAHSRELLVRTRDALDGRPWGVGILGFADQETRAAQLAAVREIRPTHAVLAGGRPAQAAALEAAGIAAFVHVPSSGLLRQFLAAGVRRFVFEGAECGGHVGPLHAFALWEAQLGVLADHLRERPGDAGELEILCAGGIHDARSAAMVRALTAPLTARGAAVGLLMGTAYLLTEEAVDCGAVRPQFQRQVVGADRTVLLRTAPGHATRCVPSPFTEEFGAARARLRDAGLPDRDALERLERLNVGRLRIASKGVERRGGELSPVAEERQLAEGMFMAGQVAVLRTATTTLAALHREVTEGADAFLRQRAATAPEHADSPDARGSAPRPVDVAVVGMACVFPGAADLDAYWANILAGADAVTEVPATRWDPAVYFGTGDHRAAGGSPDRTVSKWGGFLPPVPFDPLAFGIPPASLGSIEPVQLLALQAARRALDDAGLGDGDFDRARTSVVFGAEAGSDLANATTLRTVLPAYASGIPAELADQLPTLTEDSFPGMLANVIAGRVANRLDLGGANCTVDAACASSLAAVDLACKELVQGGSDLVLCGGADLHNGVNDYLMFSSVGALSPTGRCRTFDAGADGIALGEGVACVALKRLDDAERAGDRVYAVIRGVGSAGDGRGQGLTAPRPEGQRAALERAYRTAGVSPAAVGLVEAHGTGTVTGDRTELSVLTEVFADAGAAPGRCALGSVKSQIGHTKCAAGLAGLIKAAMALHTGVLPPTRQLERPNPAWRPGSSPFVFHTEARPWAAPPGERVAGVSAFGFGGTNFHVVLSAPPRGGPPPASGHREWPAELFTFRGRDAAAARQEVQRLLDLLDSTGDTAAPGPRRQPQPPRAGSRRLRLRDLAATVARRSDARPYPVRIAVVAPDSATLRKLLRQALAGGHDPGAGVFLAERAGDGEGAVPAADSAGDAGRVALLFPGQGSQRPGMCGALLIAFPELQHPLQQGAAHASALYPPTAFGPGDRDRDRDGDGGAERLMDTGHAQPALGIASLAVLELLTRAGVRADMAAGHSYGELVALCAAGALAPEELPGLSEQRAEAVLAAAGDEPGAMAAVAAGPEETGRALAAAGLGTGSTDGTDGTDGTGSASPASVVVANHNAPGQTAVAGPAGAVREAVAALRAAGHGARLLPVSCAFHSPLVAGAGERFAEALGTARVRTPRIPVWANRTAAVYPAEPDAVRAELTAQIGAPVRFAEQIEAMYRAGARVFVEAGPGDVLTGLVGRILADRPHTALPFAPHSGAGGFTRTALRGLLESLARLAVAGLPVRTGWLFHGRRTVDAERAPDGRAPGWTVDGHLVRDAEGHPPPGGLRPARRIPLEATVTPYGQQGTPPAGADRDALITEFLRSGREMIAAQRDVLLARFGAAAPPPTAPVPLPPAEPAAARHRHPAPETAPQPEPDAVGGALSAEAVRGTVLEVISERTGYPADMIEPDLDLEAELSVDSIKRTEIAGELAARLGGSTAAASLGDDELEELSRARTAAAIASWLAERLAPDPAETPVETPAEPPSAPPAAPPAEAPVEAAPLRMVLRTEALGVPEATASLDGSRFALLGGGEAATALAAALSACGARPAVLAEGLPRTEEGGSFDGVCLLSGLAEGPGDACAPLLPDLFPVVQSALRSRPRWLICAYRDAAAGAGIDGLFRTVAREHPDTLARAVRLEPGAVWGSAQQLAGAVLDELSAQDRAPVVVRTAAGRFAPAPVEAALEPAWAAGGTGAGPGGSGAVEAGTLGLDRDSVVVLAGGARGITARCALGLARAARCRLELLGRTPQPAGPEEAAGAGAPDAAALRAALAAAGGGSPAEIERTVARTLARREVAATLEELREAGSPARYHGVDARDAEAVRRAVKEIAAEHGRVDLVVCAAGVIEDRLLADKDPASFERVYQTKVDGARHLLDAVAELPEPPCGAVLFGSVAAVLGSRGQCDYAAANDALQQLGSDWSRRTGRRALTVHWGPWAPSGRHGGMVSAALGRDFARRGVQLIDPDEGVRALLRELAWGDPELSAVVLAAPGW
ncbi:type I polyketide synthase [Streptomyces boncukensis]|uniref:SDR family NAD(P)-dependent oxidoreductase n=1 Tax=Streptomyces boncukensis TaxID=2711219 RepID=A0A6G4WTB7_9ACTN|nr:type I polyketide synthase [Streptomyces boncukensis]NGO67721.1 SDR family NAD(P)-dependent oxidoreductase [Streptomyces boncukensis]